jgi:acetyl esterase/lipase
MTTAYYIRKRWRIFCINARIADTATVTENWIFNWICLVNNNNNNNDGPDARQQQQQQLRTISRSSRTKNLWYSNGRIRFQLIKRGMDIWYATVGKAVELTNGGHEISDPSWNQKTIWTYVVASLAASYYNCVGPTAASALALANSPSSVIQEAWGVVSMPAVKRASLEATRILKGAAIADRVDICGVSCFVLSQEPIPALSLALRRYQRRQEREGGRLLDTILERTSNRQSSLVRDNNIKGFQKYNVILHLTGGGFFAHTIAGDLPYLLDWSASSKAVIIVPEYSLVPRKYPDAITEIVQIYSALRYGQATAILGFQPDRIIVSGESVGGNLATALCVSLIMNHNEMGHGVQELTHEESFEMVSDLEDSENEEQVRMHSSISSNSYIGLDTPDALLLCCPALNLSLEPSPSRIHGAHDPVLPSALFSTISTSYLGGCLPTDPVASPYFASDATICSFPPTLIFTSSDDPLLDDSVSFNGRLRSVGVSSRLRAVHDMPHAFWALSTAGIPEARQVQKECQRFLSKMFDSSDETEVFD